MLSSRVAAALAALSLALPALAQDVSDDWEVRRDRDLMVADVIFDSGLALGVRCQDGGLGVVVAGLPPARGAFRTLAVSFDDAAPQPMRWIVTGSPTAALAELPAPLARALRQGGRMNLVVPDGAGEGRSLRYALDLPASPTAIEAVMRECGKPLEDPRDALLSDGDGDQSGDLVWSRAPDPEFPSKAWDNRVGGGLAFVSCLTTDEGELEACEVESEHPMGAGFGRAGVRAMRRARVSLAEGTHGRVGGRMIVYSVRFGTFDAPGTGATRLAEQRDRAGH